MCFYFRPQIFFIIILFSFFYENEINSQSLALYDFSPQKPVQLKLNKELNEISGLSVTPNGRLFAHADEKGNVYEVEINSGKVIKKFRLGENSVYKDFEGIAIADKKFFLITGNGELYLFYEQEDGAYSKYKKIKTSLAVKNDVEGLCFDPSTFSLLIACKGYPGKGYSGYKAVYAYDINTEKLLEKPRFLISLKELKEKFNIKRFSPSGIEMDPKSGSFFILSSDEKCIVEISPKGEIINAMKLNGKYHRQPEGITFLSDSVLIISDEGSGSSPTLTKYFLRK